MNLAVGKHARRRHHRRRQARELRYVRGRSLRFLRPSGGTEQHLQRLPARRQCRVQVHGAQVGLDRGARVARCHEAMTALLVQPTVIGMDGLEVRQRGQRIWYTAEVALADRPHVPDVAILGHPRQQRLGCRQRRRELALVEQPANAQHFCFDAGLWRLRRGNRHQRTLCIGCIGYIGASHARGGHRCPPLDSSSHGQMRRSWPL